MVSETANGLLYWPDQQLNAIKQVNPDGSDVATFATASNPLRRLRHCHADLLELPDR